MARYGQIKKGVRARKRIELPMMDGSVVACDVVPLLSSGDAEMVLPRFCGHPRSVESE